MLLYGSSAREKFAISHAVITSNHYEQLMVGRKFFDVFL